MKTPRPSSTQAERADPYALYEASVQSPELEIEMLASIFARRRGRRARLLREDFAGTSALSAAWARSAPDRRAIAVDHDPGVLAYGYLHHVLPLGPGAGDRIELRPGDVREVRRDRADVICAYNFSYWTFKTRRELLGYFRAAREGLAEDGMFFLDLFGGSTAMQTSLEVRELEGFEYVWEQASFCPLTHDLLAHIHFRFPDGSRLLRAFTYDWRLWTLVELTELLEDAGFSSSDVYWEDRDREGTKLGRFRRRTRVDNEPGWNAYLIAER